MPLSSIKFQPGFDKQSTSYGAEGKWIDGESNTGRIIHVPNGKVFTEVPYRKDAKVKEILVRN